MNSQLFSLAFLLQVVVVLSHSWLACTDYRGPVDYYDDTRCLGYPREWATARASFLSAQTNGYQIGGDSGYNYQPGAPCNLPMGKPWDSSYTANHPYATYEQGGVYCLAWPTKNHVAASCTNAFIPDTKMTIFRSAVNLTTDPADQATFSANEVSHNFGVHTNGQVDCLGYQRSPKFCDNTDKAMATGCIKIPADLPLGTYVFQWYWIFNPGSPYTTCWDAKVVAPGAAKGSGGLIGADSIVDNLGSGGSTCRTNWQTQAFTIPTIGGNTGGGGGTNTTTGTNATKSSVAGGDTTTNIIPSVVTVSNSSDSIAFVTAPPMIVAEVNYTFYVVVKVNALGPRVLVVDILNLDTNPVNWYGKGLAYIGRTANPVNVNIQLRVYTSLPISNGYVLRAWLVDQTIFNDTTKTQPWTQELDRRDRSVLVGSRSDLNAQASGSSSSSCNSSNMYSAGAIAATFFGTILGMLLIFAIIFFVVIRPRMK